jgi:aminocarboxymuconate-semialdehyde decarboxylase
MPGSDQMRRYWLPWLVGMPAESSRAICSMIFGGVFEKFPKLRVAFCHGGGSFAGTIGRIEHGFKMRPDLVAIDNPHNPREYCGHFWVDTLTFDEHILHNIIRLFGSRRVALGSDYPFPLGEIHPGRMIEELNLDRKLVEDLFQNAPLEWLGLDINKLL